SRRTQRHRHLRLARLSPPLRPPRAWRLLTPPPLEGVRRAVAPQRLRPTGRGRSVSRFAPAPLSSRQLPSPTSYERRPERRTVRRRTHMPGRVDGKIALIVGGGQT